VAERLVRRAATRSRPVEEAVDFAFSFATKGVRIAPSQVRSEILELLRLLETRRPRRIMEIGRAHGGTLFLLAQVAAPDAALVSLDLPGGAFGGTAGGVPRRVLEAFARPGQTLELWDGDSHDPAMVERAVRRFGDDPLDFLLVDGDHTFAGVKSDVRSYGRLVRDGGLIALHDIVPGPEELVGGVPKYWEELRAASTRTTELVERREQGGYGIGVVFVGG
jgi:cephalosporin hydroxylase